MPANFTPLADEVGPMTSAVDSAVALMDGFESRLQAAIEADNLSDNSNVAQFASAFSASKQKLAEAVARNTPAAEEPAESEDGVITSDDDSTANSGGSR
jgi:hypothetical protein